MKRSQELFEKIENYLNNDLPGTDKEQFEKELQENEELRNEVQLHREMQTAIGDADTIAFRKKIEPLSSEKRSKKSISSSSILKIAAVFIVILATTFFLIQSKNNNGNGLFQDYYVLYPVEDLLRGQSANEQRQQLLKKYSNMEFAEIVDDLESLSAEFPEDSSLQMYLGNCYLNTGADTKAVSLFDKIPADSKHYDHAQWYLALAYLKEENREMAKKTLEHIVSRASIHKENALELLSELEIDDPDDS